MATTTTTGDGWCEGGERIAHSRWRVSDYRVSTREITRGWKSGPAIARDDDRARELSGARVNCDTPIKSEERSLAKDEGTTDPRDVALRAPPFTYARV